MFRDISNLRPTYYTSECDVLEEFFNPVLSTTNRYDRVSGYFSSKALAMYSKGLGNLVHSNGHFRLIISENISEEDFDKIKHGYDLRYKIEQGLLSKFDENLDLENQMNISNLAYLIAKGFVDIKIAFIKNGLFHSKFGICEDEIGDKIYFTGSNNETYSAIVNNYESFDITVSWSKSEFEIGKIENAEKQFDLLWNDEINEHCIYVKEINEVVKKKIMTYSKGKIVIDTDSLTNNAVILTIEENRLTLINNLEGIGLDTSDYVLSNKMARFCDKEFPNFKADLSYIDMEKVGQMLTKYFNKKNITFIISNHLKNYIEKANYRINERYIYGTLIKQKDSSLLQDYKKFEDIVNRELHRPLRNEQMWSAFYLTKMKKAANFSVPGAGKTSMVLGSYSYLSSKEIDLVDRIIMIGPKNSFESWKNEFFENFEHKKELRVLDIHDEAMPEIKLRLDGANKNLILINYESLKKYEPILHSLIDDRTMLIFDEVHRVKGIESSRAESSLRISKNATYKYVLTGTPIPNSYLDISNFLHILYPEEYKSFFDFSSGYLTNPNLSEVQNINNKLYPFFWRTTKTQLQVPDANPDEIISLSMNDEEQELINMLYQKYKHPFNLYIRLIQASSNPQLLLKPIDKEEIYGEENESFNQFDNENELVFFSPEEVNLIRRVNRTQKYHRSISLAEELYNQNKQCIVWCIFINTIDSLYSDLKSRGVNVEVIYGSTPMLERNKIIERFQHGEKMILITNPHTLAESVSLHKKCHDAIYLEYSFNLTHMIQSRDRIHRLGLLENQYTQYYYLMLSGNENARNTIDKKIYYRLREKQDRMVEAVEGTELFVEPNESLQDIVSLFSK